MSIYGAKTAYQDTRVASDYDAQRFSSLRGRLVHAREMHAVRSALKHVQPNARILDLPCGTGRVALPLLQNGLDVWGSDISESMLAEARRKLQSSGRADLVDRFSREDAEKLSYPDGAFEAIVSLRLMCHLPPEVRRRVLTEMKRVSNSWLIVGFPISDPIFSLKRSVRKARGLRYSPHPVTWRVLSNELSAIGLTEYARFPVAPFHLSETYILLLRVT